MPTKLSKGSMELERKKMWQDLHHGASVTVGDGDVMVIDILKLSLLSPLFMDIIKSLNTPNSLKHLIDFNIILPDFKSEDIGLLVEILDQTCCNISEIQHLVLKELVRVMDLNIYLKRDTCDVASETFEMQVNSQDKRFFPYCSKVNCSSLKSVSSSSKKINISPVKPPSFSSLLKSTKKGSSPRFNDEVDENNIGVKTCLVRDKGYKNEVKRKIDNTSRLPTYKSWRKQSPIKDYTQKPISREKNSRSKEDKLRKLKVSRHLFEEQFKLKSTNERSAFKGRHRFEKSERRKSKEAWWKLDPEMNMRNITKEDKNYNQNKDVENSTFGTGSSSSGLRYRISSKKVGEPNRTQEQETGKHVGGFSSCWSFNEQGDFLEARSSCNDLLGFRNIDDSRWSLKEDSRNIIGEFRSPLDTGSERFNDLLKSPIVSETFDQWSPDCGMYQGRRVVERVDEFFSHSPVEDLMNF